MEPFLTRDGRYLFFNNRNDPGVNTDMFWAEHAGSEPSDNLTFQFRGPIEGVNTPALEGVASIASDGTFYFISPQSYEKTASTIYRGHFVDGKVTGVELVPCVSRAEPGIVQSTRRSARMAVRSTSSRAALGSRASPGRSRRRSILRAGRWFVRDETSERIMRTINTDALNYAPDISASLELFFTRVGQEGPAIYSATRASTDMAFGLPKKIEAITGFVEAPSISPYGHSLYYHLRDGERFVLYCATR